jgi:hypothetical protein
LPKKPVSPPTPRLLLIRVDSGAFDGFEQDTGEGFDIERIGPGGADQFAQLRDLLQAQGGGLVLKGFQFGIDVTWLAHGVPLIGSNGRCRFIRTGSRERNSEHEWTIAQIVKGVKR